MDKTNNEDESQSIRNQKLLLMDYALSRGWGVFGVYSDDDYSGLDRNRPAFNKLLEDARNGKFNIILCKTQSRFTRDMELVEKYIHGAFIQWGIRFVSIVDNVDTNVKGNKKARQINGLVNEWYCEELSENIRAVFRKKMEAGQFLGPHASYGYVKDPADRHMLLIDEEAALVVKTIFMLYLQGHGCQQIAQILTADRIPTPTVYKRARGIRVNNPHGDKYSAVYGVWANNTVNKILKNEVYIGTLIQGREKKLSYKDKKVISAPKEEWVIIKNNHEPIIDINDFNTVQELLHERRQVHKPVNGGGGMAQAHLLAGKVRCLDCGSAMQRSAPARNGGHYLRCALAYKTRQREQVCTPHTIKLEMLAAAVENKIRQLAAEYAADSSETDILRKLCSDQGELLFKIAKKEKEINDLKKKSDEMSNAITQAYMDKTGGILTEAEFVSIKTAINLKIQQNKEMQSGIESWLGEMKNSICDIKNADEILQGLLNFRSLTHEMVNYFIDYIGVGEKNECGEQRIVVNWNF